VRLLIIRHGQTPCNVSGELDTAYPGGGLHFPRRSALAYGSVSVVAVLRGGGPTRLGVGDSM
jgi:hypothetical protein